VRANSYKILVCLSKDQFFNVPQQKAHLNNVLELILPFAEGTKWVPLQVRQHRFRGHGKDMIKIGMHGVEAMALFGVAGAFPKDKIAIVIPKL